MSLCTYCDRDMQVVDDCRWNRTVEFTDGTKLPSVTGG